MSVIRILLLLVLMGIVPVFFSQCDPCKCEDPGPDKHYLTDSINVGAYYYHVGSAGFDTALYYPYDSVSFRLRATDIKRISSIQSPFFEGFSLTPSAYACSCREAADIMDNYISSIEITSKTTCVYRPDLTFSAGETITNYFSVQFPYDQVQYTIKEFVSRFKRPGYTDQDLYLYLNIQPAQPVSLICDVKVKLNDGKVFIFEKQELRVR